MEHSESPRKTFCPERVRPTQAAHDVTHWPGRIVMVGYAMFVYMTVLLYVANLSAFFIMKPSESAAIVALSDVPRLGAKLCLLEAMSGAVTYAVPTKNQHW